MQTRYRSLPQLFSPLSAHQSPSPATNPGRPASLRPPALDSILPHLLNVLLPAPLQRAKVPHTTLVFLDGFMRARLLDQLIKRVPARLTATMFLSPQGSAMLWSQLLPYCQSCGGSEGPDCHPGERGEKLQSALLTQGLRGTGLASVGLAVMCQSPGPCTWKPVRLPSTQSFTHSGTWAECLLIHPVQSTVGDMR